MRDSIRSLRDILVIKYHQLRGRYDSVALDAIVVDEARAARVLAQRPVSRVTPTVDSDPTQG